MAHKDPWDRTVDGRDLAPESLMMGYGYEPAWSEGALKSPIFQTSTFVFSSAEEGKHCFEIATGQCECEPGERPALIYSRLSNPDLEILEDRLTLWDGAERALVFGSGMAAIATTLLSQLRPGDRLLHTAPLYGGTDHLVNHTLPAMGIVPVLWELGASRHDLDGLLDGAGGPLRMIFMETPANPTLDLFDISLAASIAASRSTNDRRVLVAVDNTFLGPVFQHPLQHGADLVVYSATKYIGGHSDVVAGAVLGPADVLRTIAEYRTVLGTMASPFTGWLLMRSLETLALRMDRQVETAQRVVAFLVDHPRVRNVRYLSLLEPGTDQHDLYKRQCLAPGAMIAFDVDGGEPEAFKVLNALRLVKLAVSLGSTESLAEHPATMTHADVDPAEKAKLGVGGSLIRLSIGVERPEDLIADLAAALNTL